MDIRRTWRPLLTLVTLLACGCATVLPVHTAGPPQTLGSRALQIYTATAVEPVVGPALNRFDLQDTPADVTNDYQPLSFGVRFGVLDNLDAEFEATKAAGSASRATLLGFKYQWLGRPLLQSARGDWIASLRVRYIDSYGNGSASGDSNVFGEPLVFDELHAHALGLEQALGYQLADWAVLSLGVNWHRVALHSRFRESDPADIWYEDHRHLSLFGANASLCLVPHGPDSAMHFCIEDGVQHLQRTFDSTSVRNVHVAALSLGLTFRF